MEKLKLLDLFSGIGGFSLGLERSGGFETVAFCEIAPKCRHLLTHHWPSVPVFPDITTLTGEDVGPVDAICGGFPCQDISLAGKGAGLAGERSGLWREYARLVRELRPAFVIVENVSALLGRGLGEVLGDLAALGYDAWWDCIPASAVGAPHRRDRLWIVAYARGQQHQGYGDALRREIASGLSGAAMAYADSSGLRVCGRAEDAGATGTGEGFGEERERLRADFAAGGRGDDVAHASRQLWNGRGPVAEQSGRDEPANGGASLADAMQLDGQGLLAGIADQEEWGGSLQRQARPRGDGFGQWSVEPDVGRVAHGVPARVDRLHGLGNAVVPQIPEMIGRAIIRSMSSQVA